MVNGSNSLQCSLSVREEMRESSACKGQGSFTLAVEGGNQQVTEESYSDRCEEVKK